MIELSIIIPTKNEEIYLPKLLGSIKRQNLTNLEIIVADANSKDKTREIARSYGCKVVEGGVLSIGRNNGARAARGDLLLFIDADIIMPDIYLPKAIEEFEKRKLDVAGTLQTPILVGSWFKNLENKFYYEVANHWMKFFQRSSKPFMQVCMFARKEVHDAIGGFGNFNFAEDSEYAVESVRKGYRFGILDSGKVLISTRRFEKEGSGLAFTYTYYNLARLFGKKFDMDSKTRYTCS